MASGVLAKVKSTSSELSLIGVEVVELPEFATSSCLSLLFSCFFEDLLFLLFLENKRIAAAERAVTADAITITCFLSMNKNIYSKTHPL